MSFNYRNGGSWQSPTVKRRENNQWVSVNISDVKPSGDFQWRAPPKRSSTIYSENYSSLQNALDDLSTDEELIINDGPHDGPITFDQSHATLSGGNSGAILNLPSEDSWPLISTPDISYTFASSSPINEGDTKINVDDASIFSAGDDVRIYDENQSYRGLDDLNTGSNIPTGEFQTIRYVDTSADTLTLYDPITRDYPNESGTLHCDLVHWALQDVHFHNLTLNGHSVSSSSSNRSMRARGMRDAWFTNLSGATWSRSFISFYYSYNVYVDNCSANDLGRNGFTALNMSKNIYGRNLSVTDVAHYGINGGWDDEYNPAYNQYWVGCTVENAGDAGYDQHHGSEKVVFKDCDVINSGSVGNRLRGLETKIVGGTYDCDSYAFQMTQKPENVFIKDLVVSNCDYAFLFWLKEGYDVDSFHVEDSQFTVNDRLIRYRPPNSNSDSYTVNIEFVNCSIDGEWVTDYHINQGPPNSDEDWLDINSSTKSPTDQTPAEYFM